MKILYFVETKVRVNFQDATSIFLQIGIAILIDSSRHHQEQPTHKKIQ